MSANGRASRKTAGPPCAASWPRGRLARTAPAARRGERGVLAGVQFTVMPAWVRAFGRPGALSFALLFAIDSLARSTLTTVIPLTVLKTLGNARDTSVMFFATVLVGVVLSWFIPTLVRKIRPRWVYSLGAGLMAVVPFLLATETLAGLAVGMSLRVFASSCLLNGLNLYIMAYIKKQDFVRSEPLRIFFAATCWTVGPGLGVLLYNAVDPWATYGLSSLAALVLLLYFWRIRMEHGPAHPARSIGRHPWANVRRYIAQPRLRLAWLLSFGREVFWVMLYYYMPAYMVLHGKSDNATALLITACTVALFLSPGMGWLGRRFGVRRHLLACFVIAAAATLAAVFFFEHVAVVAALLILGSTAAVGLDSVVTVPFLRAVRARERPEMTMVYGMYRDLAGLLPTALFSALLTFFDLRSVFLATGLFLVYCAWMSRWVPRSM